jgi:cation:H+ antiporter
MTDWYPILWAAPTLVFSAVIVGWAAEAAQLYISQGLALAILAWLQTSPEFAVEAVIAWQQKQSFMIANLTGSLRLLVGFGWPLVYFTNAILGKNKKGGSWPVIKLPWFNGLEVLILLLSSLYFTLIWFKGSLTVGDSCFLFAIYGLYLVELTRLPKGIEEEGEEDLPWVANKISKMKSKSLGIFSLVFLFGIGAFFLKISTPPFLKSLEGLALALGVSSFYFIQWVAPFLSEFPEKVTAFQWARTGKKAPMAVINMVSSNVVQWTVMAGMIPVVFSLSLKAPTPIVFDHVQLREIALTVLQSFLSILFLMDLELDIWNATGLLVLWSFQFFFPSLRSLAMALYGFWIIFETISLVRRKKLFYALNLYRSQKKIEKQ